MRILFVEDEEKFAFALKTGLEKTGFAVDHIADGAQALRRIEISHDDYDLIVLDLMLPTKDGFEICRAIREKQITTPVLVLTAKGETENKISALNLGADDYLSKPFSFDELVARIRALLRRPKRSLPNELTAGRIRLDPITRKVLVGEKEIPFTLKEYALLELLMRNPNKVLNREEIFSHLWDFADNSLSNTIDVHIKNIRKKLDAYNREKNIVETIRGVGYRLKT